jgi:hypothetical protein
VREFLHTLPLSAAELAICVAMSAVVSGVVEIEKWWRRYRAAPRSYSVRLSQ